MENIIGYQKCYCGAITLFNENGDSYSCKRKNLKRFFGNIDLRKIPKLEDSYCCDHCVNHYGLDLCGCGSGEDYEKCDNDLPECGIPMQKLGEYTLLNVHDSWVS